MSFFFAFPWFFPGKQQFPYVLDGFGVISLVFLRKNMFFCFFLGKTAVSLCFGRIWRDFPWFSYKKHILVLDFPSGKHVKGRKEGRKKARKQRRRKEGSRKEEGRERRKEGRKKARRQERKE